MAKRTLLAITQSILSAIDSDEVNSISDTIESLQVVDIIRSVYEEIREEHDLPSNGQLFTLEDAATATYPTRLKIPDRISSLRWVKYAEVVYPDDADTPISKKYKDIEYLEPEQFLHIVNQKNPLDTNITVVDYPLDTDIKLSIQNDKFPQYWTSFNDQHVWFDSFNDQDSTLVGNHTQCFGLITSDFELDDDFIPNLPANLFPYFESTCMSRNIAHFKQEINPEVARNQNRLRIRSQRNKHRARRRNIEGPDYGKRT